MAENVSKNRDNRKKIEKGNGKSALRIKNASILLLIVAFIVGVFFQDAFDMRRHILHVILPKDYIQRQKLKKILDIQGNPTWSGYTVQREKDYATYKEQLIEFFRTDTKERLGAYLLIPKAASTGRLPAALCIPGHHSTKETVAGIEPSPYNITYGYTLVQANYIVLVPDIRYSQDIKGIEDMMGLNLIMYGKSLIGERLKDLIKCVTFLEGHQQVDSERIGAVGWSMGGGLALYLSAIDKRIKLSYVSCYFGTYEESVMAMRQSTDNYVPGIKNFGELYDVAALVAPRPLLIEHSTKDREFPVEAVKTAFDIVKNKYALMRAPDKIALVIREGGHVFYGDQLVPWFNRFFYPNG